ncbi:MULTISPECIES: molecular chaperone [Acinetobacter]|nr:molecular chaperone [Acinetobacter variabilis]
MKGFLKRQIAVCGLTILLLPLMVLTSFSHAAGFSVSPIKVNLTPENNKVMSLRVHNSSNELVALQAEVMGWNQKDGKDLYESKTREILVTPPIFTVPPGETQIIRVGLRRPLDLKQELSYRLFLQELPPPIPNKFQGLQMVMRMSLPVFVAPATGQASSDLSWRIHQVNKGNLILESHNRGNGHAQVTELRLKLPNGQELVQTGNTYLLPGSKQEWSIDFKGGSLSGATVTLVTKVNGKTFTRELRME